MACAQAYRGRGGVVYLEASNPELVLGELAASEAPFDSWYGKQMRTLFGLDLGRLTSRERRAPFRLA